MFENLSSRLTTTLNAQRGDLVHHRLVHAGTPGAVDDQDVGVLLACFGQRRLGDIHRVLADLAGQALDLHLPGHHPELFNGRRAVDVGRDHQHFLVLLGAQPARQLAHGGGLAGALQAGHQDHRRRLRPQVQFNLGSAQGGD